MSSTINPVGGNSSNDNNTNSLGNNINASPLSPVQNKTKTTGKILTTPLVDKPPVDEYEVKTMGRRLSSTSDDMTASLTNTVASQTMIHANASHRRVSPEQSLVNSQSIIQSNLVTSDLTATQATKLFQPGVTLDPKSANIHNELYARVNQDRADMETSAKSFSRLNDDPQGVISKCLATFEATEALFTDSTKLREKISAHVEAELEKKPLDLDEQQLKDMGFDPAKLKNNTYTTEEKNSIKESAINKMSKNLGDYFYHTINHAKEMFADTYVRLKEKGFSDHLCLEGAMVAFEHDLVQGLGVFPSVTGQNENITAKLLNVIMKEANPGNPELVKASQDLANATIVGGTLLVKITRGGTEQNKAITQFTDNESFAHSAVGTEEARNFILALRDTLAVNDTDRTRLTYEPVEPPHDSSALTRAIFENRNKGIAESKEGIKSSAACAKFSAITVNGQVVRENEISRFFQSIRILGENAHKNGLKEGATVFFPARNVVLNYFKDPSSVSEAERNQIEAFTEGLTNPAKWTAGLFTEVNFAKPSGHDEYVAFLNSTGFAETMKGLTSGEKRELFRVAIQDGQVGEHLSKPSDLVAPIPRATNCE